MLTNEQRDLLISQGPAEKVTKEYMDARIAKVEYVVNRTSTVCMITLDNGFIVEGFSACAKVENYKKELGEKISYDNAYAKLWAFFGFLLVENGTLVK